MQPVLLDLIGQVAPLLGKIEKCVPYYAVSCRIGFLLATASVLAALVHFIFVHAPI